MDLRKRTRTHDGKLNFSPSIWGEKTWDFIHIVAISYPNLPTFTDKKNYRNFFYSLGPVLPCERCTSNYENHLNEYPIDEYLKTPEELFHWTVLMRNLVKRQTLSEHGGDVNDPKHYYNAKKLKKYYCDKLKTGAGAGAGVGAIFKSNMIHPQLDKFIIFIFGAILISYVIFSMSDNK